MGYGCPPPLAGGGVAPGDADTRVITALLAAAALGGWGKEVCGKAVGRKWEGVGGVGVGGGGGYTFTPAPPFTPPSIPSCHTVRVGGQ